MKEYSGKRNCSDQSGSSEECEWLSVERVWSLEIEMRFSNMAKTTVDDTAY